MLHEREAGGRIILDINAVNYLLFIYNAKTGTNIIDYWLIIPEHVVLTIIWYSLVLQSHSTRNILSTDRLKKYRMSLVLSLSTKLHSSINVNQFRKLLHCFLKWKIVLQQLIFKPQIKPQQTILIINQVEEEASSDRKTPIYTLGV